MEKSKKIIKTLVKEKGKEADKAFLKSGNARGEWKLHYGKVTGLGFYTTAGGKEVVILWDEGGASRMQGGISNDQWEIFKLAFKSQTGRICILSDKPNNPDWKFDYRFLEAQR